MMRRFSLRSRLTALAALTVGVALTIGAFLLVVALRSRLDGAATTAAELRARDVAALVEAGVLPRRLALPGEESAFVQVVDENGGVVASTENIDGEPPVVTTRPDAGQQLVLTTEIAPLDDSTPMRVAVRDAPTDTGTVTVYAGESLIDARATTSELVVLLAFGVPLLALLAAAVTWWATGRTLRPIREITRTMSEITTSDLHRRVPEPDALDEIGELAVTVNDTLERLDESVETQRRFVADASHELRGPLAALRADIEISVTHPAQTDWIDVARATLGDVERLQRLTDDLLLLARLDARLPLRAEIVDLAALANELTGAIRRNDVTVTTTGLDAPAPVRGDPSQLRRMIRNLVHNAEQHARSKIDVSVTAIDATVRLVVGDDGPGIPPEDRDRVLQRFVRLDTARSRDSGGTGLGLAIAADVVSTHGGAIVVDEGKLGGAEFTVDLDSVT